MKTTQLPDGAVIPVLGQGTWHMGEGYHPAQREADSLRLGIDLGMTLIDTAEMYGDGAAERVVGQAIAGRRDEVFLVSKVYPQNASRARMARSCEASLKRLGTDCLDLYLLHWRGGVPLGETIEAFEALRDAGKIRRWGVSNFDVDDMEELDGAAVQINQVLYNPEARGIEFDLMPWCVSRHIPIMAYTPVGQAGALLNDPALKTVAARHGVSTAQVALAWSLRFANVVSIPKAADPAHVRANAAALALTLDAEDCTLIDRAFPPPKRKRPLEML
jgi:diketogulonate reductase-like aldo/keto reductase